MPSLLKTVRVDLPHKTESWGNQVLGSCLLVQVLGWRCEPVRGQERSRQVV